MRISQPIYSRTAIEGAAGVCSGGHPDEATAGAAILAKGGNAVDALIAAAFVAFVVEPASCGLGGYGHTSVWIAKERRFVTFDAYVRAPGKAHARMFKVDPKAPFHYYGHPTTLGRKAEWGFLSVAVPGAVRGFADLHAAFGRLPWKRLLEPAIARAEAGLRFDWQLAATVARAEAEIRQLPDTAAVLLPGGRQPRIAYSGDGNAAIDTSRLAVTLKEIAAKGAAGFHQGRVASAIARYVGANGGILSEDDLAGFKTRIIAERPQRYRGHDYVACFDQVAYEALNILEGFDLRAYGPDSYAYRHLAAEALALAFTDSIVHYGDPDFVRAPVNGLANPAFAAARRRLIRMGRAVARPVEAGDPWPYDDAAWAPRTIETRRTRARREGTSQVVTADAEGNLASTIISLSAGFGSLVFVPEVGIFLNNSMQNFDPRPDHPNHIQPGKMPVFAAPAIVAARRGAGTFAGAGSGGYRIETGVLHTMMNVVDFGMGVQQALDHPRVHSQGQETVVDRRIPAAVIDRMRRAGHAVEVVDEHPGVNNFGRVVALARSRRGWQAGAYPAWATGAAGI